MAEEKGDVMGATASMESWSTIRIGGQEIRMGAVPFDRQTVRLAPPLPRVRGCVRFWFGSEPRPCTCLGGPCDGGPNGCGYDPTAWDQWEALESSVDRGRRLSDVLR